ncbi:uncharacterized protein PV09_08753 [Verruconis gallopava]|uniref:Uncharacterized protein n=1 Tax=Verruconis gallopava TaxID=253628 RepID=A0A0D1YFR0_9PEZI|nr:uncharacterized protein PV09_08753 [Verruconis gallopava]KIV99576.1 hypothetical protein PV09_08753 [Verruconis gallopava]
MDDGEGELSASARIGACISGRHGEMRHKEKLDGGEDGLRPCSVGTGHQAPGSLLEMRGTDALVSFDGSRQRRPRVALVWRVPDLSRAGWASALTSLSAWALGMP